MYLEKCIGTASHVNAMQYLYDLFILQKQFPEFFSTGDPRFFVDVRKMVLYGLF